MEVIIQGRKGRGGGGLLIREAMAAVVQRAEKDIRLIMSLQGKSCQHRVANRVTLLIPEAATTNAGDDDDAAELLQCRCAFLG